MDWQQKKEMDNRAITKAASILNLPPLNSIKLGEYAHKLYSEFLSAIGKEVPRLQELAEEDRTLFLSEEERAHLISCETEINDWLQKCGVRNDSSSLELYPYNITLDAMWDLRKIIKKIADQKLAYIEKENLKSNRLKALKHMNVPLEDAEKYLTAEEYRLFKENLRDAADAYINNGKGCYANDWRLDIRADIYMALISVISERRQEDDRRRQAALDHSRLQEQIRLVIQKCKYDLSNMKKPNFGYPATLAKYQPHNWCELEQPKGVTGWATPHILKVVPEELRRMVYWDLSFEMTELPYCKYTVIGLPCLTWCFKRTILVKVFLRLKNAPLPIAFRGQVFSFNIATEELGCVYLGPIQWGDREGFITPLILLLMLSRGQSEAPGIKVLRRSGPLTTFSVAGFPEEIVLHDDFVAFIEQITMKQSPAQALLSRGLIDTKTGVLVKGKLALLGKEGDKLAGIVEPGLAGQVVEKLITLGWTENDALKVVNATNFSQGSSVESIVKDILANTTNST